MIAGLNALTASDNIQKLFSKACPERADERFACGWSTLCTYDPDLNTSARRTLAMNNKATTLMLETSTPDLTFKLPLGHANLQR